MEISNIVFAKNNQSLTTSRLIAEKFGKRHKDVLRAIRNLDCDDIFTERNFAPSTYKDPTGRELIEFIITKDGFIFLVMGFTGKQAAKFKIEYINAFNKMDAEIKRLNNKEISRLELLEMALEAEKKRLLLEAKNEEMKPKADYYDDVMAANSTYTVTILAKDLGFSSAIKLNQFLKDQGVQFKSGKTWVLYAEHQNKGYTETVTLQPSKDKSFSIITTVWTERGREFIYSLIQNKG